MKFVHVTLFCTALVVCPAVLATDVGETMFLPALGDVDRDGLLTRLDVTQMVSAYEAGETEQSSEYDFNGDGVFDMTDASDLAGFVGVGEEVPAHARELVAGDVTGDQRVSLVDLSIVLTALYHPDELTLDANARAAADLDGDGRLTLTDVLEILRYVEQLFGQSEE